jgi:hypothetical protein
MGLGNCIKGLFLLATAIAGLVGVCLVFYSGVTIFDRDLAQAQADKMADKLSGFIKCDDVVAAQMNAKNLTDSDTRLVLTAACQYQHTPALTLFCVGGTFALFSVLSGLVSGCRDVKGNLYAYTVISGASLALLVTSMFWMNVMTANVSQWLTACGSFNDQTIQNIQSFGYLCVENNETAKQWLARVALFYGGAIVTILSLLVFLIMNSCASGNSKNSPLASTEVANYNYHGQNRA